MQRCQQYIESIAAQITQVQAAQRKPLTSCMNCSFWHHGPLAGFLGIRYTYNDIRLAVQASIEKTILPTIVPKIDQQINSEVFRKNIEFYENLFAGTALSENDRHGPAIDRLIKCLVEKYYYDIVVLDSS